MRERSESFEKNNGGSFRPTWSYANVVLTAPEGLIEKVMVSLYLNNLPAIPSSAKSNTH